MHLENVLLLSIVHQTAQSSANDVRFKIRLVYTTYADWSPCRVHLYSLPRQTLDLLGLVVGALTPLPGDSGS